MLQMIFTMEKNFVITRLLRFRQRIACLGLLVGWGSLGLAGLLPMSDVADPGGVEFAGELGEPWSLSTQFNHPELRCLNFVAPGPEDSLFVSTFNNSRSPDIVSIYRLPRARLGFGEPVQIFSQEVEGYRGFSGLATDETGILYVSLDRGPRTTGSVYRLFSSGLLDPSFGDRGRLDFLTERPGGLVVDGPELVVLMDFERLVRLDRRTGAVLGTSQPRQGEPEDLQSSRELTEISGEPLPIAPLPLNPSWISRGNFPQTPETAKEASDSLFLRDLILQPSSGIIFAVGQDQVYSFQPIRSGSRDRVGPDLVVSGAGPIRPGQGIFLCPRGLTLYYAVNRIGTLARLRLSLDRLEVWEMGTLDAFIPRSLQERAVDGWCSSDGRHLWVTDLGGGVSHFVRGQEGLTRVGTRGINESQSPVAKKPLKALIPAGSLFRNIAELENPIEQDQIGGDGQNVVVLKLVLFSNRRGALALEEEQSLARVESLSDCLVRHYRADVQEERLLALKYGIYVSPTLLILGRQGQEIARHEGDFGESVARDLIQLARNRLITIQRNLAPSQ